jgi:hypothetical protein
VARRLDKKSYGGERFVRVICTFMEYLERSLGRRLNQLYQDREDMRPNRSRSRNDREERSRSRERNDRPRNDRRPSDDRRYRGEEREKRDYRDRPDR